MNHQFSKEWLAAAIKEYEKLQGTGTLIQIPEREATSRALPSPGSSAIRSMNQDWSLPSRPESASEGHATNEQLGYIRCNTGS